MNITPIVNGGRPLTAVGYKYNASNFVGLISTEGGGSTELVYPYLSLFPDIYSNVSNFPIVGPHFIVRCFNTFNAIDNHDKIRQSDPALEKYWVKQGGYF